MSYGEPFGSCASRSHRVASPSPSCRGILRIRFIEPPSPIVNQLNGLFPIKPVYNVVSLPKNEKKTPVTCYAAKSHARRETAFEVWSSLHGVAESFVGQWRWER